MSLPTPIELQELRHLAGRTQGECGELLGVSRTAYGNRENGMVPLSADEWNLLRPFLRAAPDAAGVLGELRRMRLSRGLSNRQCGEALALSREMYRLREDGTTPITGPELAMLARGLYGMRLLEAFPSYRPTQAEALFLAEADAFDLDPE